eukprot:750733-Hanusia_phi.AAC.7
MHPGNDRLLVVVLSPALRLPALKDPTGEKAACRHLAKPSGFLRHLRLAGEGRAVRSIRSEGQRHLKASYPQHKAA